MVDLFVRACEGQDRDTPRDAGSARSARLPARRSLAGQAMVLTSGRAAQDTRLDANRCGSVVQTDCDETIPGHLIGQPAGSGTPSRERPSDRGSSLFEDRVLLQQE
jgi:hypothetical protein